MVSKMSDLDFANPDLLKDPKFTKGNTAHL